MQRYPLHWPAGHQRTPADKRINSPFMQSMEAAQKALQKEIRLLKATNLIVSTDIPTRADGGLYADYMRRKIEEPGVAIYFTLDGKSLSMACDQYARVWENIYALAMGIAAMRAIERWGISGFMQRAFTGFAALPAPVVEPWWQVLGMPAVPTSKMMLVLAYREAAKTAHPDAGGTDEGFAKIQAAYNEGLKTFNL